MDTKVTHHINRGVMTSSPTDKVRFVVASTLLTSKLIQGEEAHVDMMFYRTTLVVYRNCRYRRSDLWSRDYGTRPWIVLSGSLTLKDIFIYQQTLAIDSFTSDFLDFRWAQSPLSDVLWSIWPPEVTLHDKVPVHYLTAYQFFSILTDARSNLQLISFLLQIWRVWSCLSSAMSQFIHTRYIVVYVLRLHHSWLSVGPPALLSAIGLSWSLVHASGTTYRSMSLLLPRC